MIRSFADRDSERLWSGVAGRNWSPEIAHRALQKLRLIDTAARLEDLRIPPGDRKGFHSIRINDQWRVCFRWIDGGAFDVEVTDYH